MLANPSLLQLLMLLPPLPPFPLLLPTCSLRAPRPATRERPAEPWATDAKDFLRKRAIGRAVDVKLEYTRKVSTVAGGEGGQWQEMRACA